MTIQVTGKNLLTGATATVSVDSWGWKDKAKEILATQWGICFDSVKVELA